MQSAEALEEGLEAFEGTVLAVTHDRWFARGFDRFLVYGADGEVYESDGPVWDEATGGAGPMSELEIVEPLDPFDDARRSTRCTTSTSPPSALGGTRRRALACGRRCGS